MTHFIKMNDSYPQQITPPIKPKITIRPKPTELIKPKIKLQLKQVLPTPTIVSDSKLKQRRTKKNSKIAGNERVKYQTHPTYIGPHYELFDTGCQSSSLCDDEHCQRCYQRSFCSKHASENWSTENLPITPRMVTRGSGQQFWFNCSGCCHKYMKCLSYIEGPHRTRGCPFCNSNQERCLDEKCTVCEAKSFAAAPDAKKDWSALNENLTARQIARSGIDVV